MTDNVPVTVIDFLTPAKVLQDSYLERLGAYEVNIKKIIQKYQIIGFGEEPARKMEPKDKVESPIQIFDAMQFHPKVIEASKSLFETGNYASAILEAFKAVNIFVKAKSGLFPNELRGINDKKLMAKVFNEKAPLIELNELVSDTDVNEQEGFKFLFMGAMEGIRNPKAKGNIIQKDPFITLEYLGFASLLLKRIEGQDVD